MTDDDDTSAFDAALRAQLHDGAAEPDDDGFSLRVMAALPARVVPRPRHWARQIRHARWASMSIAACALAAVLSDAGAGLGTPRALAAVALIGLLVFWSIPSRLSRA